MNSALLARLSRDVALCIGFYTRLPLPYFDMGGRSLAQAQWAAPLAGAVIGLIGAAALAIASMIGIPPAPAAAIALAAVMFVTGMLHEDGISDTVDGFGGGRTRERALEIMRDSRIGSYGAGALILSVLLRWSALAEIDSIGDAVLALIAAHAASRALIPAFMQLLPNARLDGLAVGAGRVESGPALIAAMLGMLALLPLGFSFAVTTAILLLIWLFAFRRLALKKIGGQTGDTIGAFQQGCEIIVLLLAPAFLT